MNTDETITIYDVAREAGVSMATVSRVVNGNKNVLILDEPTNDLDIETLEILEEYLDGFAGIVITVSHDRYFLDRVVDRIFAFEAGGHLVLSQFVSIVVDVVPHDKLVEGEDT